MIHGDLKGKKLLILGASSNEITLVKRAQEYGIYVIVTDNIPDREISRAKQYADEVWDISWSDIDTLEEKCRLAGVNAVMAGYSEIRVMNQIKLCERLGLPCYMNERALDLTSDKIRFKELCRKHGVPVVREYDSVENVNHYPVIVKPTDRGGSIGISVAHNHAELKRAYDYAMEKSYAKRVVIEDYIQNATKIDSYYTIKDGRIEYITLDDVIFARENGDKRVVQSGWLIPSVHEKAYLEKVDQQARNMLMDLGLENGYIFISGFVDSEERFVIFECGMRLDGGHYYYFFPKIGGYNYLDLFLCHAFYGNCRNLEKDREISAGNQLKCATVNYYAKQGTIKKIQGFEKIKGMDDCDFGIRCCYPEEKCTEEHAILSKLAMFHFVNRSADQLADDVKKANEELVILNENNEDMIYDRMDENIVRNWWDRKA